MRSFYLSVVLAAGALGFGLAPSSAQGAWRRNYAIFCMPGDYSTPWQDAYGVEYAEGTTFLCPYNDDDQLPHWSVSGVNVHGNDNNHGSQMQVSACIQADDDTSVSCGDSDKSGVSFTGDFELHPDLTEWTSASGAGYAYLQLDTCADCSLFGYFVYTE